MLLLTLVIYPCKENSSRHMISIEAEMKDLSQRLARKQIIQGVPLCWQILSKDPVIQNLGVGSCNRIPHTYAGKIKRNKIRTQVIESLQKNYVSTCLLGLLQEIPELDLTSQFQISSISGFTRIEGYWLHIKLKNISTM